MNSIHAQLTLRLFIGGILLLGAAGITLHWQVRRALVTEFDATLQANAQSLASKTEQKNGRVGIEFSADSLRPYELANGPDVFLLSTSNGKEIRRSASLGSSAVPIRDGTFDLPMPDGRMLRCIALRFAPSVEDEEDEEKHVRRKPDVEAMLIVGRDRGPLDHTLAEIRNSLLVVGVGALTLLAALVRWGVRGGLAPLDRLGESVATVDAASLSTRFSSGALPSELRPIAERLNELLSRLESAFSRERRFTATAAHELRTPLAELRSLAEVNLSTPATEAEQTESWQDALATTLRMESLSLSLLELARAEDPGQALHFQTIPLSTIILAAWEPWESRAAQRGIHLNLEVPTGLTIKSDPALLGVILGNLCSNAAEHGSLDTPFGITAIESYRQVAIHFRNQAPDLTQADLPHLFERFWRKDNVRTDGRHHGFGLSLAADFTKVLGGTLDAQLHAEEGLEITLRLPIDQRITYPSPETAPAPASR